MSRLRGELPQLKGVAELLAQDLGQHVMSRILLEPQQLAAASIGEFDLKPAVEDPAPQLRAADVGQAERPVCWALAYQVLQVFGTRRRSGGFVEVDGCAICSALPL